MPLMIQSARLWAQLRRTRKPLAKAACLAVIVAVVSSVVVLAACGDGEEDEVVVKPSDVITCFEAAGEVSESTTDSLAEKAERDGLGYLDADFAYLYFFNDADAAEEAGKAWQEEQQDVREFIHSERRANIFLIHISELETEEAGVLDRCLADAGEPVRVE